jgi:hypothetical protein
MKPATSPSCEGDNKYVVVLVTTGQDFCSRLSQIGCHINLPRVLFFVCRFQLVKSDLCLWLVSSIIYNVLRWLRRFS